MYALKPEREPTARMALVAALPTKCNSLCVGDRQEQATLATQLAKLQEAAVTLDPGQRQGNISLLRQVWVNHQHSLTQSQKSHVLQMAICWSDYVLVHSLLSQCGVEHERSDALNLCWSQLQLAQHEDALAGCRRLLFLYRSDRQVLALYEGLRRWYEYCALFPPPELEKDLYLQPLGRHHVDSFRFQYVDSDIPALCCLPNFENDEQWLTWLDEQYDFGDQLVLAVMHTEWGFIGSVSLVLHRGVGFFYYWIGNDFRNRGFGSVAVGLLMRAGLGHWGMHCCYAKVLDHNLPSLRVMQKLGFVDLQVRARYPDQDQRFIYLGAEKTQDELKLELAQLLFDMDSTETLALPSRLLVTA